MMKCKFCGSNIDIESDVCPFCGLSKSQFESHRKDMRDYSDSFRSTRDQVVKKNQHFSNTAAYAIALSALIVGILLLLIGCIQSGEIHDAIQVMKVTANADKHIAQLDKLLEEGEYNSFQHYFYEREISEVDRDDPLFSKYQMVYRFASQYNYSMSSLRLLYPWNQNEYSVPAENAQTFAHAYASFLDTYNNYVLNPPESSFYHADAQSPEMLAHIENMKQEIEYCMMAYLGIDEETIAEMQTMNEAHICVTIENALSELTTEAKEDPNEQ